jgi:hypothetical protein
MTTTQQPPSQYDEKVETENGTRFYRVGRTVICVDDYETLTDHYASVAAAKMVLDMARS